MFRRTMLGSIVGLVVLGLVALPDAAEADVREGQRAPEFVSVKDAKGKRMRLRSFRGKVVVLSFGASWCKPCKKEFPAMERSAVKFTKMGAPVVFIAVNTDGSTDPDDRDEEAAKGRVFVKRFNMKCTKVGYDPTQRTVGIYNPQPQPSTYIIDRNGIVRHIHRGYVDGDDKKIAKLVDSLIAK